MAKTLSNVFPLLNAHEFEAVYHRYEIKGLNRKDDDHHLKLDIIARKVSSHLKVPVTTLDAHPRPLLVVPQDAGIPQSRVVVFERIATFQRMEGSFDLTASRQSEHDNKIRLNLLRSMVQDHLRQHRDLWQPHSSGPFYEKHGQHLGDVTVHRGFKWRVIKTGPQDYGISIDPTVKFIRRDSLPANLTPDEFERLQFKHVLYKFGHQWYEIKPTNISDHTFDEYPIKYEGGVTFLREYIKRTLPRPHPPAMLSITEDTSVLEYRTVNDEVRAAPVTLCHPVLNTKQAKRYMGKARISPEERFALTHKYIRTYLHNVKTQGRTLKVAPEPLLFEPLNIRVPDLEFANHIILSTQGTRGARNVSLRDFGQHKKNLLYDKNAGFYSQDPCYRFYLVMPDSAIGNYGDQLKEDLEAEVLKLVPDSNFKITLIEYSDSGSYYLGILGRRVLDAIEQGNVQGKVMIMLPTPHKTSGEADPLAALLLSELYQNRGIEASVIHTETAQQFFELLEQHTPREHYGVPYSLQGPYRSYLRNIAINKILYLEHHYPFVLAKRTHADLTIGLDVKAQTMGLLGVNSKGTKVYRDLSSSKSKEKLSEEQVYTLVKSLIEQYSKQHAPAKHIVLHRDGRMFPEEVRGAKQAIERLIYQNVLDPEAKLTLLEIHKSAFAPVRFYSNHQQRIQNPKVGTTWMLPDQKEAYVATTGFPYFKDRLTALPLHVRYIEGALSFKQCLEDLFHLSNLTWSQVEGCSRYPLTTLLNDRFLEEYSEEERDQLDFGDAYHEEVMEP